MRTTTLLGGLLVAACDRAPAPTVEPPAVEAHASIQPDTPDGAAARRDAELAVQVAVYFSAFTNSNAEFSQDGARIVFSSDRDGLPQLYVADAAKPDAPATRLTNTTERVMNALTLADGQTVLYASDHGADENWSLFTIPLAGGEPRELTPGEPLNRDFPLVADGAPTTLWYSARERAEPASTLYSLSLSPGAQPVEVYHDDGTGFLVAVSPDAHWALWVRYPSRSDNTLMLVDLARAEARPLYPAAGPVSVTAAEFSPDGELVYVATDGGGEQALVLALERSTGAERARYVETRPTTASIPDVLVAKTGAVALTVDAGNHTEIRLLDGGTLQPGPAVTVALGMGGVVAFSDDGRRLSVNRSTPSAPSDVVAVDVATGAVTPLRTEPRPSLGTPPPLDVSIVEIPAFDGLVIPTNVILPADLPADKKLPVIVAYHGGPSGSSYVRWLPVQRFFLAQGYAWVEPNVRGSGGFGRAFEMADNGPKRLDAFEDVEASARWVAAQPWADKDRLVVFGGSYGGYTVLTALERWPDQWRAGVDLFGVVNMQTFLRTTSGVIQQLFLLEFGDVDRDAAFLDTISPSARLDAIVDPLFVYAGANDPRVPRTESDQVVAALRERSVPVEYMVADNEGHSIARRETQVALYSRVARFLETTFAAP